MQFKMKNTENAVCMNSGLKIFKQHIFGPISKSHRSIADKVDTQLLNIRVVRHNCKQRK